MDPYPQLSFSVNDPLTHHQKTKAKEAHMIKNPTDAYEKKRATLNVSLESLSSLSLLKKIKNKNLFFFKKGHLTHTILAGSLSLTGDFTLSPSLIFLPPTLNPPPPFPLHPHNLLRSPTPNHQPSLPHETLFLRQTFVRLRHHETAHFVLNKTSAHLLLLPHYKSSPSLHHPKPPINSPTANITHPFLTNQQPIFPNHRTHRLRHRRWNLRCYLV